MTSALTLENLAVVRRLQATTLNVRSGECVGLIGRNGSGKTTLLRAIIGALPTSGHCSLHAVPIRQRPSHLAYLAQERNLVWPITAADCVALGSRSPHDPEGTAAILARVGLAGFETRPVTTLSGGEKAAVLLARTLLQKAPLLLADEPTAALDPAQAMRCMGIMRQEAEAGRAVVTSLHDLSLAARYCTRLVVMERGAVIADGRPDDLFATGVIAKSFGVQVLKADAAGIPYWLLGPRDES